MSPVIGVIWETIFYFLISLVLVLIFKVIDSIVKIINRKRHLIEQPDRDRLHPNK